MDTRTPYETLIGKSRQTIIRELEQVIGAAKIALLEGSQWMLGQRAPNGPIMAERDISYVYKCIWGAYAAGLDQFYINEMLDWLQKHALQPSGDFFFPEEAPDHRVDTRAYRQLVFMKFAALLDHPLVHDPRVMHRMCQYQDSRTGGCYYYIGEDPANPETPDFLAVGDTAFFGEFALAAGQKEAAVKAGEWMLSVVQQNVHHMTTDGIFYCLADRDGALIIDVGAGEKIFKTINNRDANQMGWNIGCAIALLADVYDALRGTWGYAPDEAQVYLDAALAMLDFEDSMPLYTYFYPSKCKVVWGAAQLLRTLLRYGLAAEGHLDSLYRISKRVFLYTFLGSQLPDGSWPAVHYPLTDDAPELQFDYRVLKGLTLYPSDPIPDTTTSSYLPAVEVVGEILGEIGAMVEALSALLHFYRDPLA